jgi:hypothetical protein
MAGSGGSHYQAAAIASTSHGVCSVDFQLEKAKSNPDYHLLRFPIERQFEWLRIGRSRAASALLSRPN